MNPKKPLLKYDEMTGEEAARHLDHICKFVLTPERMALDATRWRDMPDHYVMFYNSKMPRK